MCEDNTCGSVCSPEIAAKCPIVTSMLANLETTVVTAMDQTWEELQQVMEREELTLPLSRQIASNMMR